MTERWNIKGTLTFNAATYSAHGLTCIAASRSFNCIFPPISFVEPLTRIQ